MNYRRIPLFAKHAGEVQLPVFIKETSDANTEAHYEVSVHPSNLHKEGTDFEQFKITKYEISRIIAKDAKVVDNVVINEISDLSLREFVFDDDGRFFADGLDWNTIQLNARNAKELAGKELFNLSNIYAPLKIYRLKRISEKFYSEKSYSEKSATEKISRTFWDMEVLDHDQDVPCARSGHKVLVDAKNNRLFLMGGITILADKSYQGNIEDIDNNWFYYPLNDVWKLDLNTGKWERMMDLSFNSGAPL